MKVPFSERPGRHERHYRRRIDSPLFGERRLVADDESLLEHQRLDHEALVKFVSVLRATFQRAVELQPNEGSETVLELKEQLDRLYEEAAGLPEDHANNQSAINQLLEVIMRNVERGAAGDVQAQAELVQERDARALHQALLAYPLVADLLHPESPIASDDLAPTLLSSPEDELDAALALFDAEQLAELLAQGTRCIDGCSDPAITTVAAQRLEQVRDRLQQVRGAALS